MGVTESFLNVERSWRSIPITQFISDIMLSSFCLSSVTFVRPTKLVEIVGNVSSAFGTLAIR